MEVTPKMLKRFESGDGVAGPYGYIIDLGGEGGKLLGLPAVSVSFVLPLLCFVFIAIYGWRTFRIHHAGSASERLLRRAS